MIEQRDRVGDGKVKLEEGIVADNLARVDREQESRPPPVKPSGVPQPVQGARDLEAEAYAEMIMNRGKES
jgi:hypothetical protein